MISGPVAARRVALVLCILVVGACGPGGTGAPGATVGASSGGGNGGSGNGSAACPGLTVTLSALAQIEAGIRTGALSDPIAESEIQPIQQLLSDAVQVAGRTTAIGGSYESLILALDELGTALNQSAGVQQLNPLLDAVDQAATGLRSACGIGG